MVSTVETKKFVDQPHMACPVGNFTHSISYLTMKPIDLDDKAFEGMAHDLEMITGEFMENYNLSADEMHGVMLAQIVRFYIDNGDLEHCYNLMNAVVDSIEERMDEKD